MLLCSILAQVAAGVSVEKLQMVVENLTGYALEARGEKRINETENMRLKGMFLLLVLCCPY